MRDSYVGDIGDYAKYGLLRAVSTGRRLGVAWYRCSYGASKSSGDGGLTQYLSNPGRWRHLDPKLFVTLKKIVYRGTRSVAEIQASEILGNATFHDEPVDVEAHPVANRKRRRDEWFEDVMKRLHGCDLVFADPDNGLASMLFIGYNPLAESSRLAYNAERGATALGPIHGSPAASTGPS